MVVDVSKSRVYLNAQYQKLSYKTNRFHKSYTPVVSLLFPGLPSRTIARTVSLGLFVFFCFFLFFLIFSFMLTLCAMH